MKNTVSNIKPTKTEKQSETTYCFGCKNYTNLYKYKLYGFQTRKRKNDKQYLEKNL